jgi:retinoid hydroxylase
VACSYEQPMSTSAVVAEGVERIPVYREGGSDEESFQRFEADRAAFLVRAYRTKGPIFRTWMDGKMLVIMAGLEANDFVWRNSTVWDYPIVFPAFLEQMGPNHLNVLEGEAHRHKRTILKPAFDQAPAMRFLPGFNEWFGRELSGAQGRGPIDLVDFWAQTITKANTKTVAQAEVSDAALKRLVNWETQMLAGIQMGEARHAYYGREEYLQLRTEAKALMNRIVEERLADPGRYDDNYAGVLKARSVQEGGYPDRESLIDDLYYILVAGVENTSRLINWTALQCLFAPEWLARVRAELDGWDGRDVAALAGMASLKAVIMETQRLRPPAFFVPRRAAQDFQFEGYRVPAGTDTLTAHAVGHYLDEIYPNAFSFQPERFLENGRFAPRASGFFGGGVHICLGRNLTLMQTPVALAQLLKYHDVAYADEAELRTILGVAGRPFPLKIWAEIKPRQT